MDRQLEQHQGVELEQVRQRLRELSELRLYGRNSACDDVEYRTLSRREHAIVMGDFFGRWRPGLLTLLGVKAAGDLAPALAGQRVA